MPFRAVRTNTNARLIELQHFHRIIVANEAMRPAPTEHPILKGHFVVGLYAYFEHSLAEIIKAAIAHVNSLNIHHRHLPPGLYTLTANPQFMSAADSGGEKKWNKRHEIISSQSAATACSIDDTVLGREIQNTRVSTVEMIFRLFDIKDPPLVSKTTGIYINEIGERRNAVAHGRESAASVGGRFSAPALGARLNALEQQSIYMIACFEGAATKKSFIKPSCRRFYP